MHIQVLLSLGIRNAALRDQAHSLKLELSRELPSLHDAPPVPSKHLTRCLRNRVQANRLPRCKFWKSVELVRNTPSSAIEDLFDHLKLAQVCLRLVINFTDAHTSMAFPISLSVG